MEETGWKLQEYPHMGKIGWKHQFVQMDSNNSRECRVEGYLCRKKDIYAWIHLNEWLIYKMEVIMKSYPDTNQGCFLTNQEWKKMKILKKNLKMKILKELNDIKHYLIKNLRKNK